MDDLEVARKALAHAAANPDAFTAEEINAFADTLEGASKAPAAPATEVSTPLTRNPKPDGPGDLTATDRQNPAKFAQAESAQRKWSTELFDNTLPTASKVRELARDPEYHHKAPKGEGFAASLLDPINAARQYIPSAVGGKSDHLFEPSVEQFRNDMRGKLEGVDVDKLDDKSMQYRMYADGQWAKAYDQAKAEGRSVVRHAYKQSKDWGDRVAKGAWGGAAHVASALHGADELMTFGAAGRLTDAIDPAGARERQSISDTHPASHTVGQVVGGIAPQGLANKMVAGAGALARGVAPAIGNLPGVVRAGTAGAASGITDVAGQAGVAAASGDSVDAGQTGKDALITGLLGGALGGGASLLGSGAKAFSSKLRERIPELPVAEQFGGKTSVLSGFKPGDRYKELAQEARAAGTGPQALLASKLGGPLAEQGALTAKAGQDATGAVNSRYYQEHANTRVSSAPLIERATELFEKFHDASGKPLPGAHESATKLLRAEIGKMADVKIVPLAGKGPDAPRSGSAPGAAPPNAGGGLGDDIEKRLLDAAGGKRQTRVNLADLRKSLGGNADRAKVDETLLQMQDDGRLVLYRNDNTARLTDADKEAAIMVGGHPRHLALLEMPKAKAGKAPDPVEELLDPAGPRPRGEPQSSPQPAGQSVLTFAEARRRGLDVEHLLKGLDDDQRAAIESGGAGVGIGVTPRKYNPEETDQIISGIDNALKAAQGPGGGPHKELNSLLESSRAVRDQFPESAHVPGGWSKFKHDASLRMAAEERAAGMAGVPGAMRGNMTANEAKGLHANIMGYGDPMRHPEIDQNLRRFAQGAGGEAPRQLEDLKAARAVESMEDKTKILSKLRGAVGGSTAALSNVDGAGIALRADPIARLLAGPRNLRGGYGGAAAVPMTDDQRSMPPLSFDEINRLLDPNHPFR